MEVEEGFQSHLVGESQGDGEGGVKPLKLSPVDQSRLDRIKREVKERGYAVTMADLKFLVRVLERAGL
jgi:hypothetical protein